MNQRNGDKNPQESHKIFSLISLKSSKSVSSAWADDCEMKVNVKGNSARAARYGLRPVRISSGQFSKSGLEPYGYRLGEVWRKR